MRVSRQEPCLAKTGEEMGSNWHWVFAQGRVYSILGINWWNRDRWHGQGVDLKNQFRQTGCLLEMWRNIPWSLPKGGQNASPSPCCWQWLIKKSLADNCWSNETGILWVSGGQRAASIVNWMQSATEWITKAVMITEWDEIGEFSGSVTKASHCPPG